MVKIFSILSVLCFFSNMGRAQDLSVYKQRMRSCDSSDMNCVGEVLLDALFHSGGGGKFLKFTLHRGRGCNNEVGTITTGKAGFNAQVIDEICTPENLRDYGARLVSDWGSTMTADGCIDHFDSSFVKRCHMVLDAYLE